MRKRWKHGLVVLTAVCALLLTGAGVWAAGESSGPGAPRSRVFKFRHITSQQAQETLKQLNIGSGYNAMTGDVLIVTGTSGSDLIKASEVLTLLDRKEPMSVRTLMTGTETEPLPSLETLTDRMKTVTAGTLLEGPANPNKPVIADIVDNRLIAIASTSVLDEMEAALTEWRNAQANAVRKAQAALNPETPSVPETDAPKLADVADELFGQMEQEMPAAIQEPAQAAEPAPTPSTMKAVAKETAAADQLIEQAAKEALEAELLKELAITENKARQQQAAQEAEAAIAAAEQAIRESAAVIESEPAKPQQKADVQAPAPEAAQPDADLMKMLQALMAQEQTPEQTQEPAAAAEPTEPEPAVADVPAAQTPSADQPLKAELDGLREQLARLEQMLANGQTAPAATPAEPSEPPVEIEPQVSETELDVVMDLPQEIDLESLVDLVGKQLGLNYMYDKAIMQNQKVQLKVHGGKIKVGEVYDLLESVLRFKGFVMTRRSGLVTILRVQDATKAEPVLRDPGEPIPPGEIIVSTVFRLNHIDVNNAETMLRGMNLGSTFTKINETNTLIVTDYSYRMSQIRQVLEMIDVKGEMKEYKFRTLKYLSPSDLVPKLKDLAGQLQGVNLQITTGTTGAAGQPASRTVTTRDPRTGRTITQQVPTGATPGAPAAGGAAEPDSVFIDTDDRTNRVLIAGKPGQIELINELIDALDVPQYDLKYVREYIIQYVEAAEVVNVLNGLGLASVSVSSPQGSMTQQTGRLSSAQLRAQQQALAQGQPQPPMQPQMVQPAQAGSAQQPYISIRPATNSLLVNATAEQHKSIELVIAHVDVIQKDQRTIRQYEIQHVDTQEILDTLTNLGIVAQQSQTSDYASRTTMGQTSRTSRTMQQQPQQMMQNQEGGAVPMSLPTAEGGSQVDVTADYPQISVLKATNSLLVYATPRQHDAISLVIAHADRVPEVASTPYVVYALENQDPLKLSEVLTKLIEQTVEQTAASSSPDSKVQVSTAARSSVPSNIPTLEEERIRIIPDEESYSLIVFANKRNQQWVSDMIKELDEYRPQVLLDCILVEITQNEKFEYDLDIITKTYGASNLRSGTGEGATIGQYQSFTDDRFADARVTTNAEDAVFKAFFNSTHVQGLLTAIQQKGYGRVMARPKILVNDNKEGEIKTENKTSIAQQRSIIQPATGTSTSITTTDVEFNEYTSGVTLKIKPHISKGDMLRLEIGLTRKDFDFSRGTSVSVADKTYPRPPDLLSTDVVTVATVPDGTTIILGGLETLNQGKSHSKVPILGDIPLIGGLFRGVSDNGRQGKLYVFVKANIIRPGDQVGGLEDIRRVSAKDRNEFEQMENEFQKLQDWPGITPKPMEPERILKEDEGEVISDTAVIESSD